MYATKRRLEVLHRRGQLKARTDLPRKVFGARKLRQAKLAGEIEKAQAEIVLADSKGTGTDDSR